jgi:hypothetical protein
VATENEPTKPELWKEAQEDAKSRYAKWPSAYAVGYALKTYKATGGRWRKKSKKNGLDEWFGEEDWVAIAPRRLVHPKTGEVFEAGDIIGPCAQSHVFKELTRDGRDPIKCRPRAEAEAMTQKQRAAAARRKLTAERQAPDRQAPVYVKNGEDLYPLYGIVVVED